MIGNKYLNGEARVTSSEKYTVLNNILIMHREINIWSAVVLAARVHHYSMYVAIK